MRGYDGTVDGGEGSMISSYSYKHKPKQFFISTMGSFWTVLSAIEKDVKKLGLVFIYNVLISHKFSASLFGSQKRILPYFNLGFKKI